MESTLEIQRERTVRQQEIIDAARRIIVTKGIKYLTVREIATELDITSGALYRHFKSKKKILSLLIEDIEKTLLETIEDAIGQATDPIGKLESIFFAHLSYVEQRKGVSFIVINETLNLHDKALSGAMLEVINKYHKTIRLILNEGIRIGVLRKDLAADVTSFIFWGMIQSIITYWGLSEYEFSLRKPWLIEMFSVFKEGIRAR